MGVGDGMGVGVGVTNDGASVGVGVGVPGVLATTVEVGLLSFSAVVSL